MHLILREHLVVQSPGAYRAQLKRWATFKRRGRLHDGEKRFVYYFYEDAADHGSLWLPRGLFPYVQGLMPGSHVTDQRFQTRRVRFPFRWSLRDYQSAAVRAVAAQEGGVIEAPPGSGKTLMGLGLATAWQQPTLFLVHTLRLANQTLERAQEVFGLPSAAYGYIADSQADIGTHFTVATVQTLVNRPALVEELTRRIGTVIVDECLVGSTLVGGRRIDSLRVGDWVEAFDLATGKSVQKRVAHVFQHPAPDTLYAVGAEMGFVIATGNHPFWTRRGWVRAEALRVGDELWKEARYSDNLGWTQVDRITVLERGRDEEFSELCPDGQVYNLEIEEVHTYFANGVLTHNCHHAPADTFSQVVSRFPARYKAGLSATPKREDGLGPMIPALLGRRVAVPKAILRARGVIMQPTVFLVETGWRPPSGLKWAQTEKLRAQDRARNTLLAQVTWAAWTRLHRVLDLVERTDHARFLAELFRRGQIPSHAVYGDLPRELQDRYFAEMESGQAVVVATKLANEGLDWPRLEGLVLGAAASSVTGLEQRIGRAARGHQLKRVSVVWDVADIHADGYKKQVARRLHFYEQEGYEVRRWEA